MSKKDFLNTEENTKISAINKYLKDIDIRNYDNRFNNFSKKKQIIEWEEIENWIKLLSYKIKDKHYSGIYGIPRAGLLFAILLSYKTGLPLLLNPTKKCLIIDDDMSTGITLLQYIGRYDTAVMYKNPDCKIKPTYCYKEYGDIYKEFIYDKEE